MITEKQIKDGQIIVNNLNEAKLELATLEDALANASGLVTVKINTRWIVKLQAQTLQGHLTARKVALEKDVKDLEDQLSKL